MHVLNRSALTFALRCSLLLVLTCVLGLEQAPAVMAWAIPEVVSAFDVNLKTQSARGPVVGFDKKGRATVIWTQTQTVSDWWTWSIRSAQLAPGGAGGWVRSDTPVSAIGAPYSPETSDGAPELALNVTPKGKAVAAWLTATGGLQMATRSGATGAFSGVADLTANDPSGPAFCQTPGEPFGPVATPASVVWISKCGVSYSVLARPVTGAHNVEVYRGVEDTFGGSKVAPSAAYLTGVTRVAFDGDIDDSGIRATSVTNDVVPGSSQRYTTDHSLGRPQIAFLSDGQQILAWRGDGRVQVKVGASTDTTTDPVAVSPVSQNPLVVKLAAGGKGTAVVAWLDPGSAAWWASVMPPPGAPGAGTFGPAHRLTDTTGNPHHLVLAVSANGKAYAVWVRYNGARDELEGSILDPSDPTRAPGTPWQFQPVPNVVNDGGAVYTYGSKSPSIALDRHGNAIVVAAASLGDNPERFAVVSIGNVLPALRPPDPAISGVLFSRSLFGVGSPVDKVLVDSQHKSIMGRQATVYAGTTMRFSLSEAASVVITLTQSGCWTWPNANNQCSGKPDEGVVFRKRYAGVVGVNSFPLTGKRLRPGKHLWAGGNYSVKVVATDAAGHQTVVDPPIDVQIDAPA